LEKAKGAIPRRERLSRKLWYPFRRKGEWQERTDKKKGNVVLLHPRKVDVHGLNIRKAHSHEMLVLHDRRDRLKTKSRRDRLVGLLTGCIVARF